MTTYTLRKGSPAKTRADLVVVGVTRTAKDGFEVAPGGEDVAEAYGRSLVPMLRAMDFSARPGQLLRVPTGGTLKAPQLLLVGLGQRDALDLAGVRRAAGTVARSLGNAASVALALPAHDAAHVRAVAEGFVSGSYVFEGIHKDTSDRTAVAEVAILSDVARRQEAQDALDRARTLGELVDQAREWVNTPPNLLSPEAFADSVRALHRSRGGQKKTGLTLEVLEVPELEALGCGGILGVGQGSQNPPRLVRMTWSPPSPRGKVAFVGKGITYDSGGLSIKSGAGMALMKNDMAGAAAVLSAAFAVAALELPVAVTAYAPMAENMPSGTAMRPGDVLTMRDGRTVEVTNTDAEGRLVLADAIALAVEEGHDAIIDVATLTGACVVALGEKVAGLFGDRSLTGALSTAAEATGEAYWPLPIPEQTVEAVRESKVADVLQANWVRWGGALYAAAFLQEFTEGVPWAHLDIAGPAWNSGGPDGHVPAGATGFGVTTLVEYAASLAGSDD